MGMDSKNTPRGGRLRGWILLVACLLLLSLGATSSYHKLADTALIAIRFSLVMVLSALVLRERWKHRHGRARDSQDPGETVFERMRRWYYDERTHDEGSQQ